MNTPHYTVILLSGGMDSVTLLYDLKGQAVQIHALLIDYRQKHVCELAFAQLHCQRLNIPFTSYEIPRLKGSTLTDSIGTIVVPNRNAIFISLAVNLAVSIGADSVVFGANKDDEATFADCRASFIQSYNQLLAAINIPVEVCAPYLTLPKWKIGAMSQEFGVKPNETWSCYEGREHPCEVCPACILRQNALKAC